MEQHLTTATRQTDGPDFLPLPAKIIIRTTVRVRRREVTIITTRLEEVEDRLVEIETTGIIEIVIEIITIDLLRRRTHHRHLRRRRRRLRVETSFTADVHTTKRRRNVKSDEKKEVIYFFFEQTLLLNSANGRLKSYEIPF